MDRPYEVINSKITKIGRFTVVQDTISIENSEQPYSYIREKDCACILPIWLGNVVVINQYRHAINQWRLELPTGAFNDGELPENAARRELLEETGYIAEELIYLGECYIKPGTNTGKAHMFLAKCSEVQKPQPDTAEMILTQEYTIDEFEKLIEDSIFEHMLGIVCWLKAKKYLNGEFYGRNIVPGF
jgi:ADP-ribose pyrophosphatase